MLMVALLMHGPMGRGTRKTGSSRAILTEERTSVRVMEGHCVSEAENRIASTPIHPSDRVGHSKGERRGAIANSS